jgi:hypothetical protein
MTLADVLALIKSSPSPGDWLHVDNENSDGGFTTVCLKDVLLCLSVNLVWKAGKPYTRLQVTYSTVVLSWADLPIVSADNLLSHDELLGAASRLLSR